MLNSSPILLFVYNRLAYTRITIESLKKNEQAIESELYIYSDAAKKGSNEVLVKEVRDYIKTIYGFKKVVIKESKENKGLAVSVTGGVTEILEKYDRAIILEDDLELSPYFLKYMNEALTLYENEDKVISIHGYVYPVKELPETFFLKGADCWGWATWKRGWDLYEDNANQLLKELEEKKLKKEFNYYFNYYGMLKQQATKNINSWAVNWHASAYLKNKLTLYPGRSLVKNIGTTNESTHFTDTQDFETAISITPVVVKRINTEEDKKSLKAFKKFFIKIKIKSKLRSIIKK